MQAITKAVIRANATYHVHMMNYSPVSVRQSWTGGDLSMNAFFLLCGCCSSGESLAAPLAAARNPKAS